MTRKSRRDIWLLAGVLVVGLGLRLATLPRTAYHTDEYRSLRRAILLYDGDLFLEAEASQKPPLFYGLLAAIFRVASPSEQVALLPNLAASLASIVCVHGIARRLYPGSSAPLLAAWLMATARFEVLFAPTILLDPLMVSLALGSWWAALRGTFLAAGLLAGCAFATKQQALLLLPIVLVSTALGSKPGRRWQSVCSLLLGLGFVGGSAVAWGFGARSHPVHFISGQIENERRAIGGPILVDPGAEGLAELGSRILHWMELLGEVLMAGPWLVLVAALGLSVLVARAMAAPVIRPRFERDSPLPWADRVLLLQIVFLVTTLSFVRFRFIDRYLLPLVPFLCLGLARVLGAAVDEARARSSRVLRIVAEAAVVTAALAPISSLAIELRTPSPALAANPGVGARFAARPTLRPFLIRLSGALARDAEVYADHYTHPAAGFFLWPRRVIELGDSSVEEIRRAANRPPGGRYVVATDELSLDWVRSRLDGRVVLVPVESSGGGIRLYRVEDSDAVVGGEG